MYDDLLWSVLHAAAFQCFELCLPIRDRCRRRLSRLSSRLRRNRCFCFGNGDDLSISLNGWFSTFPFHNTRSLLNLVVKSVHIHLQHGQVPSSTLEHGIKLAFPYRGAWQSLRER